MIAITDKAREKHIYIIGKTGYGKTTLLVNMMRQDIRRGKGVIFIDPHGDAAEKLLEYIPQSRIKDTIYFEPTTIPIGLHGLEAHSDSERERLADDLHVVFRRLSESWGERMDAMFRFSFATLLKIPNATLLDLYRLLTDDAWRVTAVSKLNDPTLVNYWQKRFPKLPSNAADPILDRLSKFVLSPTLRTIIGSRKGLSISTILDTKKIFLVNLHELGEDTRTILGSILVSQIQIAAMRRTNNRTPCYFYVDEFQNFSTPAFAKILSEARKYGLHLTLSHQYLTQVENKIRDAVFGTVGTIICFRVGADDSAKLARELGLKSDDVNPAELVASLPELYAYASYGSQSPQRMYVPLPSPGNPERKQEVIKHTQTFYAVPPVDLELATEPPVDVVKPSKLVRRPPPELS